MFSMVACGHNDCFVTFCRIRQKRRDKVKILSILSTLTKHCCTIVNDKKLAPFLSLFVDFVTFCHQLSQWSKCFENSGNPQTTGGPHNQTVVADGYRTTVTQQWYWYYRYWLSTYSVRTCTASTPGQLVAHPPGTLELSYLSVSLIHLWQPHILCDSLRYHIHLFPSVPFIFTTTSY